MKESSPRGGHELSPRRLLSTAGAVLTVRISGALLQLVSFVCLARLYPVAVVGSYAAVYGAWAFARNVGPLGLDQAALRHSGGLLSSEATDDLRALEAWSFRMVVSVSLLCVLGSGAALALPRSLLAGSSATAIMLGVAVAGLYAMHGLKAGQLRGRGRGVAAQLPESVGLPVFNITCIVGASLLGARSLLPLMLASLIAASTTLVWYEFLLPSELFRHRPRPALKRRYASMARAVLSGQVAVALAVRSPITLVLLLAGPEAAARFESAQRGQTVGSMTLTAMAVSVSPAFAQLYDRGDFRRLRRLWWMSACAAATAPAALFLVTVFFGDELLSLLGERYRAGAPLLICLVAASTLNALFGLASNLYMMTDRERELRIFSWAQLAVTLSVGVAGGLRFGAIGVAAGVLVATLCKDGLLSLLTERRLRRAQFQEARESVAT